MKRMFGLDGATPLLSVSGRPENCPNLGVGFSACLEVGRNSLWIKAYVNARD
jgi:hypothetical protein